MEEGRHGRWAGVAVCCHVCGPSWSVNPMLRAARDGEPGSHVEGFQLALQCGLLWICEQLLARFGTSCACTMPHLYQKCLAALRRLCMRKFSAQ